MKMLTFKSVLLMNFKAQYTNIIIKIVKVQPDMPLPGPTSRQILSGEVGGEGTGYVSALDHPS